MSTMPNLVGMNYREAIQTLIAAGIVPNDGSQPQTVGPTTVEYFGPWPVGISWQTGTPLNEVVSQIPAAGQTVIVSKTWGINESYSPPIVLTVNAPRMGVSSQFTAGAFS